MPDADRGLASGLLVALAETYDGEHGLAYAGGALDADPGNDRALQLYVHYAGSLQREDDVSSRYLAYVTANPDGAMANEARQILAASYEAAGQHENALQVLRGTGDRPAMGRSGLAMPPTRPGLPPRMGTTGSGGGSLDATDRRSGGRPPAPPGFNQTGGAPAGYPQAQAPLPADRLQGVLDAAQMLAGKNRKAEALAKYKEVLETDAAHPEALAWVEDHLRTKRDYAQLRDVLLASTRALSGNDTLETRRERLREVAGLCEGNLRDIEGAVNAWRQLLTIDRADESARQALTRLLEKAQRWDELANVYEQEATVESDIEAKIQLEKKLATLQENKRKDFGAAAEAWERIAQMTPEDDRALATASRLFEKAGRLEQAAQVIFDNASNVEDPGQKSSLLERLGELREQLNETGAAGDAYAEAAEATDNPKLWESAERCFVAAERWDAAANAAGQRGTLANDAKQKAQAFARAAEHLGRAHDDEGALERLEQATDLDPWSDEYANALADRYFAAQKWEKLGQFLAKRGDRLADRGPRVAVRRQAATLFLTKLGDKEAAREQWLKVLEDGDDREALEKLIDDAVEREDHEEATTLLRRLGGIAVDKADKARVALREAELLAEGVGDIDMAIARYESILATLDATCRPALQAIADLQEARDNHAAAADALERELKLVADGQERGQIAGRLARLYEQHLDDPKNAIRALDVVRKADLEDFDALTRLCELNERVEAWDRVAELLAQRIEVEGDEQESSTMTAKLAGILADKLDRGDEALAALTELADMGDAPIRAAYVELGDRLGWKGIVASKLVEWWFEAKQGPERTTALRGAFDRFVEVGRAQDAARVGIEIIRSKGADRQLASTLEELAVKTGDHDALSMAHDLLSRELAGAERAGELVRQAELRVKAGMPAGEAIQHGESGLTSVQPSEVEPMLERLGQLAMKASEVVDLYERQVTRCKAPQDRVRALARAAQVAVTKGQVERARGFFDLALSSAPTDDILKSLEEAAAAGDSATGGEKLRRTLAASMAAGGQGARDGGRSRGVLLRRAAELAHKELRDVEQAFAWLGDALIAHVDPQSLDDLEALAKELGDPKRAEETLTRALSEVFDGPLVRQLLGRRAKLRRELMNDPHGAAADLKKLHDLSPTDQEVMDELSALLRELGDYRGMVQLYEDQILRGKDMTARAELARKVARMWEEQLQDPREAADAWRRVLRMKAGDAEATSGLERAKSNMLKKPDPNATDAYAPPKLQSVPPPAPARVPAPAVTRPAPMTERKSARDVSTLDSLGRESQSELLDVLEDDEELEAEAGTMEAESDDPSLTAAVPIPRIDDSAARFVEEDFEEAGEQTTEKPAFGHTPSTAYDDVTRDAPSTLTSATGEVDLDDRPTEAPPPRKPASTRPPPLPPLGSTGSSRFALGAAQVHQETLPLPEHHDLITAPGDTDMPRAGRGLGGTDENAASFEFPEETSIGEQPRFPSESPGEEHTLVGSADESSEAIEVVDELLDEEPQTLQEGAAPTKKTRSVPPPFPR